MEIPKRSLLLLALVAVLIAAGVWIGTKLTGRAATGGASDYSAVYLVTGDVYFGKLDWFPWPHLEDVWYIERGVNQQNQAQLSVAPLTGVFWGPVDRVTLNPKQVVFRTALRNDSQMLKLFMNRSLANPPPAQPVPALPPPPGATSSAL